MKIYTASAASLIGIVLFLSACSGGSENKETLASPVKEETTTTAGSGCCFTKESDFAAFMPKGNDMLVAQKEGYASSFFCSSTDDNKRSSANKKYQIDKQQYKDPGNYKYMSLRIEDYCARPDELTNKLARKRKASADYAAKNSNVKMEDLKMDGVYEGFAVVDETKGNNSQNVLVYIAVDNRILVDITGIDHTRLDVAKQLLGLIPVKELAAFGK